MLKKILYVIVALVLEFVVFYISWRDTGSTAMLNRGNKALKEGNYEFFLKFSEKYDKTQILEASYLLDENTTTLKCYNVFSTKVIVDETKKKEYAPRSGVLFFIENINTDVVKIDTMEPADDPKDDEKTTNITFTADNGKEYTTTLSTFGYKSAPVVLFNYFTTEFKSSFEEGTSTPATKITHVKMVDSEDKVFFDTDISLDFVEHNDEAYWDELVASGKGGVAYTAKEYRDNFTFAFPEMRKTIIVSLISFLVLVGLGLFVFWPKKSYVPTKEDDDREKYTFASTDEKEKYALAKVARSKKEKEDRENRYKNVRTEKTLDEMTNEAIVESMDKENTAEAALAKDEELEKEALEKVEENELDIETDSTDEEVKEEE